MKHSCRATRKVEEEKTRKYEERVKSANEQKGKEEKEKKAKKRRARVGSCWVTLAEAGTWAAEELQAMTQDEVEGLMDLWPDDNIVDPLSDGSIRDHVIAYSEFLCPLCMSELETAGLPNFAKIISSITKGGSQSGKQIVQAAKQYKVGSRGPASSKALDAAKGSSMVSKILKDKRFLDCLAEKFEGQIMTLHYGSDEDFNINGYGFHKQHTVQTFPDQYIRTM
jgi:hypothetical protein